MKSIEQLCNIEIQLLKDRILELEKRNSQLTNLFVNGNTVIFRWLNNADWTVEYVSPNVEHILGYTVSDFMSGKVKYAEIIYKEDLARVTGEVATAVEEQIQHFEHQDYRIFDSSGNLHWVYDFTTVIYDENGMASHFYGYILDISRRKTAEHRLAQSELRFRSVFENATIGYYCIDPKGQIYMANPSLLKMLEYDNLYDLINWNVAIGYANPADRRRFRETIEMQGVVSGYDSVWRTRTGKHIYVREYASVVKDENGNTIFYEGTVEDISLQKKYEEELLEAKEIAVRADNLKSSFLANMSHEIRTPLNGILGFTQLLSDDDLSSGERKQYIKIINKSSDQLLRIISDVLDLSKIEVGELTIQKKEFPVKQMLSDIYVTFSRIAEDKGLNLIMETNCEETETIITDEHRLKQIFMNLIQNALKFTTHGNITFGAVLSGAVLNCFVADTGIGVPEDKRELIFDRFKNSDNEHAVKFGGAGLGLSICRGITELLDGTIVLDSEYTQGAKFIFTLPVL